MAFNYKNPYAPPGVYTQTNFESPLGGTLTSLNVPILIGPGIETLSQSGIEMVRGSSSSVDQRIPLEDVSGRAVTKAADGTITLSDFDGAIQMVQVHHFPICIGDGTGNSEDVAASDVTVLINNEPIVVLSVDGENGIIELASAPQASDEVLVSYYFNRTDTAAVDDVSAQVSSETAYLVGSIAEGSGYTFSDGEKNPTNVFEAVVDGVSISLEMAANTYTAAQVATNITAEGSTSLTAQVETNNLGESIIVLYADQSIVIGSGSANTILGFDEGDSTSRNAKFFTAQSPIVDGSNAGLATTDTSKVVVTVDGEQVSVSEVDGGNGCVTLAIPPKAGAKVLISYFWNSWQDTFDYLPNIGVTNVLHAGVSTVSSAANDYTQGVDFILKDDKILWGTCAIVEAGESTEGSTEFGTGQVSAGLIDNKIFMDPCTPAVINTGVVAKTSKVVFQLSKVPTTGNGRNSPLGTSLYQTVTNSRMDLPTNRPELVQAYWGFDIQDALDRGAVEVIRVDSSSAQITLSEAVPPGATVFATYYYNTLGDATYTVSNTLAGGSGVGTYQVTDANGNAKHIASFGEKGAGLSMDVVFPSGSMLLPDARFEGGTPVEETVTVTFKDKDATPAKYTFAGPGPYYFVENASDTLSINVDTTGYNIDLKNGGLAHILGDEVFYDDVASNKISFVAGVNDAVTLDIDGAIEVIEMDSNSYDVEQIAAAINTAYDTVAIEYIGSGHFGNWEAVLNKHDAINLSYVYENGGVTTVDAVAQIAAAEYTLAELCTEITDKLNAAFTVAAPGNVPNIEFSPTSDGRIKITFSKNAAHDAGYLAFVGANDSTDFWILSGFDTDTTAGGLQTRLNHGPVALAYHQAGASGNYAHDRLIIRNRILPGGNTLSHQAVSQGYAKVVSGTGLSEMGLTQGTYVAARACANVHAASLEGMIGWDGGQDASGEPKAKFYDGSDPNNEKNDTLIIAVDGNPVSVTFTSSASGTERKVSTIASEINTAITNALGFSNVVTMEGGCCLRYTSPSFGITSKIEIKGGTALSTLGLDNGDSASRSSVDTTAVANTLMSSTTDKDKLLLEAIYTAGDFGEKGLAGIHTDSSANKYLMVQSQSLGTSSNVSLSSCTALNRGTMFIGANGDGAVGEAGKSGFTVTSSSTEGSGSANTSFLSAGVGQDGSVGQTYVDDVTGLMFTILALPAGLLYDTGANCHFTIEVRDNGTCNANLPVHAIPGISLRVSSTKGVEESDTALITTYQRGGSEPVNGQTYYVSYEYAKRDYTTRLFRKISTIEANFGSIGVESPTSLAAYLMMLNGSNIVGVKQVIKEEGSTDASAQSYVDSIEELEGLLPGRIRPSVLVPLTPASLGLAEVLSRHCAIQSDIRYRSERTAILGFGAGTTPEEAKKLSVQIGDTRIRMVYPDMMSVTVEDFEGNATNSLVDGRYLAAMMAARQLSPNRDVASPWTGTKFVGTNGLARILDTVEQNDVASAGITVMEDRPPFICVRHGLTTDMSSVLMKTPTVIQIADEVQQRARDTLEAFVGVKFLPGILSQIEGRVAKMMGELIQAQIVANYTGIRANVSDDDPTAAEVEAYYQPVFPLLYIILQFNLRSSL